MAKLINVWDEKEGKYVGIASIRGEKGVDGHTPAITIQDGYWYIDGVNTNVCAEGIKGEQGERGDTGATGAKGEKGNGIADIVIGGDALTIVLDDGSMFDVDNIKPVKGTDYYTEADKAEMVDLVLAALPNGDEVRY